MKFTIKGIPKAKQSARFFARGGKVVSFQNKEIVNKEADIQWDIKSQLPMCFKPLDCPLKAKITFVFPPPSSFSKKKLQELQTTKIYKDTKPDIDNLTKMVWDAMEGIVYINDSRVCSYEVEKIYGEVPRIEIEINAIA